MHDSMLSVNNSWSYHSSVWWRSAFQWPSERAIPAAARANLVVRAAREHERTKDSMGGNANAGADKPHKSTFTGTPAATQHGEGAGISLRRAKAQTTAAARKHA